MSREPTTENLLELLGAALQVQPNNGEPRNRGTRTLLDLFNKLPEEERVKIITRGLNAASNKRAPKKLSVAEIKLLDLRISIIKFTVIAAIVGLISLIAFLLHAANSIDNTSPLYKFLMDKVSILNSMYVR